MNKKIFISLIFAAFLLTLTVNVFPKQNSRKTGAEQDKVYNINGVFPADSNSGGKTFLVTGKFFTKRKNTADIESQTYKINGILESDLKPSGRTYVITGKNIGAAKTGYLTSTQKAKIEYLEMEEESKISAIENELAVRQRLLDEEFSKQDVSEYNINNLLNDIKYLNNDLEQVKFEKKRKTRYLLTQEQYLQYQQDLEKKQKKKKKKSE